MRVTESVPRLWARLILALLLCVANSAAARENVDKSNNQNTTVDAKKNTNEGPGIVWIEASELGIAGKAWEDTEAPYDRLPAKAKEMVRSGVWELGKCSAGLNIPFTTDADSLLFRYSLTDREDLGLHHMPPTGVSGIDVYGKGRAGEFRYLRCNYIPKGTKVISGALRKNKMAGCSEFILYLPLYNGVKTLEIGIPEGHNLESTKRSDIEPIVFYGTSITQGACASRPGMAATNIVSRTLGTPVINLGFSANGWMDLEMADLMSELDPQVYVLDTLWNMNRERMEKRVVPFVKRLRKANPNTPIVLVEDCQFTNERSWKGKMLRDIYDKLKKGGDENLYFLPNDGMLGQDYEGTVDGVHPNDLGMKRQARVFVEFLKPLVKGKE